jgi:Zn-dependent protease with chaperone function
MQKLKLLFYWCLLPLALVYVGWYLYGATGDAARNEIALRQQLAHFAEMEKNSPSQMVHYGKKTMSVKGARVSAKDELYVMERSHHYLKEQGLVALATIAAATLTFLLGVLTVLRYWIDGRAALRSRERFIAVFEQLRGSLAKRLTLYSFALAVTMSLIAGYCGFWMVANFNEGGIFALFVISPVAWAVYALIRAILGPLRRRVTLNEAPPELLGRELSRSAAPALWRWVDTLAAKLNALPPEHIVVGLTESFFVTSQAMTLRPEGKTIKGRILHFPLAFASLMSQDEVACVLGHELAHFSGKDTEYSLRLQPLYATMMKNVESFLVVDEENEMHFLKAPALALAIFITEQLHVAARYWERERELVADNVACKVIDALTVAQALLRVVALSSTVDQHIGQAHRSSTHDIIDTLIRRIKAHGLNLPTPELEQRLPHPTDTHPPIRQRIAAMGIALDDALKDAMRIPTATDTSWFNAILAKSAAHATA